MAYSAPAVRSASVDPVRVPHITIAILLGGALLLLGGIPERALADHHVPDDTFRVCADPNNLPFSNRAEEGVENRIARLWADRLGKDLAYEWFPQRRGFERMTLRAEDMSTHSGYKCDVIIGVAQGWELGLTTRSYYRSTWALAYLEGGPLDGITRQADVEALPPEVKERISVATFIGTPASVWVLRNNLDRNLRPYPALDADPNRYPGQVIEQDLRRGEVDAAVLWGPVAGYFAKQVNEAGDGPNVRVVPLESGDGLKFDYAIAAGVRYGDTERRETIQRLLDETQPIIERLLTQYGFPLLPLGDEPVVEDDDD